MLIVDDKIVYKTYFDVLLSVHLSIFISVINKLDAKNFCFTISLFHASTCFEHHVLIIRRSKLHYTASGMVTPIGGRLVHRSSLNLCRCGTQEHIRYHTCNHSFLPTLHLTNRKDPHQLPINPFTQSTSYQT